MEAQERSNQHSQIKMHNLSQSQQEHFVCGARGGEGGGGGGRKEGFASSGKIGIRKKSGVPAPAAASQLCLITSSKKKARPEERGLGDL